MYLAIHKVRLDLRPGVWYSVDDVERMARARSNWPRKKVYLDWGFGYEPIHTPEELHFAARLVQTYHCQDMEVDVAEMVDTIAETQQLEAESEERMLQPSDNSEGDDSGGDD